MSGKVDPGDEITPPEEDKTSRKSSKSLTDSYEVVDFEEKSSEKSSSDEENSNSEKPYKSSDNGENSSYEELDKNEEISELTSGNQNTAADVLSINDTDLAGSSNTMEESRESGFGLLGSFVVLDSEQPMEALEVPPLCCPENRPDEEISDPESEPMTHESEPTTHNDSEPMNHNDSEPMTQNDSEPLNSNDAEVPMAEIDRFYTAESEFPEPETSAVERDEGQNCVDNFGGGALDEDCASADYANQLALTTVNHGSMLVQIEDAFGIDLQHNLVPMNFIEQVLFNDSYLESATFPPEATLFWANLSKSEFAGYLKSITMLGDKSQNQDNFRGLREFSPDVARIVYIIGTVLSTAGEYESAIALFRRTISQLPSDTEPRFVCDIKLALLLALMEKHEIQPDKLPMMEKNLFSSPQDIKEVLFWTEIVFLCQYLYNRPAILTERKMWKVLCIQAEASAFLSASSFASPGFPEPTSHVRQMVHFLDAAFKLAQKLDDNLLQAATAETKARLTTLTH